MSSAKRRLFAGILVSLCVAATGPASAAPPPRPAQALTTSLTVGPIPAMLGGKRYALRVKAMKTLPEPGTTLMLALTRRLGSATQTHQYAFDLRRDSLSCHGRRLRCRLDTGRILGRYGHVRLAVVASGRRRGAALEAGCTGTATRRAAVAALSLRLRDPAVALNAFSSGRHRASIRGARGTCSGFVPCHTEILALAGADPAAAFVLDAPSRGAAEVGVGFTVPLGSSRASVSRWIRVRDVPATSYTIARDLSNATFDAKGLAFLSGSVAYTARSAVREFDTGCGVGQSTLGGVTGDVAATFDGIGARPLTATGGHLEKIP